MMLKVELMMGFTHLNESTYLDAEAIHQQALKRMQSHHLSYQVALAESLPPEKALYITDVDPLFKRYAPGFGPIKEFLLALKMITMMEKKAIHLKVNVFIFSVLANAKNLDLFFIAEMDYASKVRFYRDEAAIKSLVAFESKGREAPPSHYHLISPYLNLRKVLERESTRNELALLALLTFSSPMSEVELQTVLNLSESGLKALLFTLCDTGIVIFSEKRKVTIDEQYLPIAVFFVRAKLGVDLMGLALRWVEWKKS